MGAEVFPCVHRGRGSGSEILFEVVEVVEVIEVIEVVEVIEIVEVAEIIEVIEIVEVVLLKGEGHAWGGGSGERSRWVHGCPG